MKTYIRCKQHKTSAPKHKQLEPQQKYRPRTISNNNYYIPKKLSRSLCIAENIECFPIFNSLERFPWKRLSYCTGPRNVLSYCTGPRKHVPGGATFASWSPLKKISGSHFAFRLLLKNDETRKLKIMSVKLNFL